MKKRVKLQTCQTNTGKSYRILLPIKLHKELEKQVKKPLEQGSLWEIELLQDGQGYVLKPCQ